MYITITSIPFKNNIIDQICEKIEVSNIQGIIFCYTIFDKITIKDYQPIAYKIKCKYFIEDGNDEYTIYEKGMQQFWNHNYEEWDFRIKFRAKFFIKK